MSEAQPDFGFVNAPVDVQWYVEGRAHDAELLGLGLGLLGLGLLGLGLLGLGLGLPELGLLDELGEPLTDPLHRVPLSAKSVGTGFEPFQEPLTPNVVLPLAGMLPL